MPNRTCFGSVRTAVSAAADCAQDDIATHDANFKDRTLGRGQISRITGMIIGRRPVDFWIMRFNSTRTFSFTMP